MEFLNGFDEVSTIYAKDGSRLMGVGGLVSVAMVAAAAGSGICSPSMSTRIVREKGIRKHSPGEEAVLSDIHAE